jgi:hypothetical protein
VHHQGVPVNVNDGLKQGRYDTHQIMCRREQPRALGVFDGHRRVFHARLGVPTS